MFSVGTEVIATSHIWQSGILSSYPILYKYVFLVLISKFKSNLYYSYKKYVCGSPWSWKRSSVF